MLVEDDNNLREIYEARLIAEGYEIVSARDGEEALAMAVKEKPDLIISDVMMPKISGFDMLDILRTTPETKNTKIIMMTALSQAEDKARADKLGADRYLVKSQVTLEDVASVAREVISGAPEAASTTPLGSMATPQPAAAAPATPVTAPASPTNTTQPTDTQTVAIPAAPVAPSSTIVSDEKNLSQNSSDESKNIEDQINQFVAQAIPQPDPATPQPVATAPATPVAPTTVAPTGLPSVPVENIEVVQPPSDPTNAATDNAAKLADAVNGILQQNSAPTTQSSATPQTADPATPQPVATAPATPVAPTTVAPTSPPTKVEENNNPVLNQDTQSIPKKVINPINDLDSKGPDLNALLEKEQQAQQQSPLESPSSSEPSAELSAVSNEETELSLPNNPSTPPAEPVSSINISEDGTIISSSTDSATVSSINPDVSTTPTDNTAQIITPVAQQQLPDQEPEKEKPQFQPMPTDPSVETVEPMSADPNHPNNIAL